MRDEKRILTESELQDFERWANGEPVQMLHCFPNSVWKLIASHRALAEQRDKYKREALITFDCQVCSGSLEDENATLRTRLEEAERDFNVRMQNALLINEQRLDELSDCKMRLSEVEKESDEITKRWKEEFELRCKLEDQMKNMEIAANIERQDAKESFDRSCLQHIDRESLLIKQLTGAQDTIEKQENIIRSYVIKTNISHI